MAKKQKKKTRDHSFCSLSTGVLGTRHFGPRAKYVESRSQQKSSQKGKKGALSHHEDQAGPSNVVCLGFAFLVIFYFGPY